MERPWIKVRDQLPPRGEPVRTKIDDQQGLRNEGKLIFGLNGTNLWWMTDGSMYVYYTPTHWADL